MRAPWIQVLAWSQMLGGVAGLLGYGLSVVANPLLLPGWHTTLALAFFGTSIAAGFLLERGRPAAVTPSFVIQALQVLVFNTGVLFVVRSGLHLTAAVASTGAGVFVGGGGVFTVFPASAGGFDGVGMGVTFNGGVWLKPLREAGLAVGVNLLALIFAIRLWRLRTSLPAATQRATAIATALGIGRAQWSRWAMPVFVGAVAVLALVSSLPPPKPNPRWALPNGDTIEVLAYSNYYGASYGLATRRIEGAHHLWLLFRSDLKDASADRQRAVAAADVLCPIADSAETRRIKIQPGYRAFLGLVTYSRTYWFQVTPGGACEETIPQN